MDNHRHDENCNCRSTTAAQSLDEFDFDRGIWSAALYNDLDRLNRLIALGHQNDKDKMGYSALHYAARNGHLKACEELLKAGADVNAVTASGGVTSLMRAVIQNHEKIVEFLLSQNASKFIQDNDGNTTLHKAAQNNRQKIIEIILNSCRDDDERHRLSAIRNKKNQTFHELLA